MKPATWVEFKQRPGESYAVIINGAPKEPTHVCSLGCGACRFDGDTETGHSRLCEKVRTLEAKIEEHEARISALEKRTIGSLTVGART